jgi:hypothetical protein
LKERVEGIIRFALSKIECDLFLKGYNMEEYGLVIKAYDNFDEFISLIKKNIGIKTNNYRIIKVTL